MEFLESEFMIETMVPEEELIISRTDLKGIITYVNETFAKISGYDPDELIGKPHNIVRHPDMPSVVFEDLWQSIQAKEQWTGVVKNLRKDKGYYWVRALVSGVYKDGELVEYKSLRTPVLFEEKCEHQILYDRIRRDKGERTRKVVYN